MKRSLTYLLLFLLLNSLANAQVKQIAINRIGEMAEIPQPLRIIDWKEMALNFDSTVYNLNSKGPYWPLVWIDSTGKNFKQPVIGVYTAIGDVRQGPSNHKGMFHEALANMGAVLGASLVGIDKQKNSTFNYVGMLRNYFNSDNGWNIMMNNTAPEVALLGGGYGRDWWYDVYPNVLFYAIFDLYPDEPEFERMARTIANQFYRADSVLNRNYTYSYFDYSQMTPMTNNICPQPDAAAGHAYVLYSAYLHFKDPRYLKGAINAMKALESQPINPTYELLMPFGAYVAARMNAEQGTSFDVHKMLDWTFDGTAVCREGWGVLTGNWNGIEISGTVGSTLDHGGYAFLMNTFDAAWPLVPLLKYQPQYANAIGKWMLNAVNAARFFYPQYIPRQHQTLPDEAAVTKGVIGYEGIAKSSTYDSLYSELQAPVAQGDGPKWVPGKNPEVSQFSVYGSGHVGIFGGMVKETAIEGLLEINLNTTDFFADQSYPSYLYYNPYGETKTIRIKTPANQKTDVYDVITKKFIARGIKKNFKMAMAPRQSAILINIPSGGKITHKDQRLLVNDKVIDYSYRMP
ncbi:hypothetical protein [Pedobacter sp.]|uniref:hypothetical protein n=1 Tax=Pedobacter sp. TaxID=1411316 RepID=UPI003D7F1C82